MAAAGQMPKLKTRKPARVRRLSQKDKRKRRKRR
jgi:hypothetical protein